MKFYYESPVMEDSGQIARWMRASIERATSSQHGAKCLPSRGEIHHFISKVIKHKLNGDLCIDSLFLFAKHIILSYMRYYDDKYECDFDPYILLVASTMMATKMTNDVPYSNRYWALRSKLTLRELNDMEVKIFKSGVNLSPEPKSIGIV